MLSEIIAFVATTRAEEARNFYGSILGLTFVADEPFALVFRSGTTMLRIQKAASVEPAPYTALGWRVEDIRAKAQALAEQGVVGVRYPHFEQDELGIWTAPGGGAKVLWFLDPDGNVLSLTQFT
jgi:catechol 2,3-dioxygenase-like lactoylglutathione lyase family enzyme